MRMRSLILYVISRYGVYKWVCFCTMMSWCSVKASAAIQNSPRSPRNVTGGREGGREDTPAGIPLLHRQLFGLEPLAINVFCKMNVLCPFLGGWSSQQRNTNAPSPHAPCSLA